MTYTKLFGALSNPWSSMSNIMVIGSCGRDEATSIRNLIMKQIKDSGKHLPTSKEKIVPTEYVIQYLGLDIEHITAMAQKEKKVKT